jgi:hypothetical protein
MIDDPAAVDFMQFILLADEPAFATAQGQPGPGTVDRFEASK